MRIGASLASAYPREQGGRTGARMMIERARAARDAGLWCLTIGDHHVNARPYYQNTPMLGRLLGEWGDDRAAGCLFLVPLWNPVLMAEQIGTLATVAGEPFIVQTGIGQRERDGMGSDGRHRGRILDEAIPLVKSLLAGEKVDSAFFGLRGAVISPTPPGPVEWWIGAAAAAGIDRAARFGDPWYAEPGLTVEAAAERMAIYRERCAHHGTSPARVPIRRDVFVAATDAEAERVVGPVLAAGYRGMMPEALAYGSPGRVAEHFARYAELGFTDVIVRQMSVPQADALRSYELLGTIVEEVASL
jgi:alkanesulfonate monooxygenase SsuD/methylene tetrahydromethanopterin reductase-like flavin-dependent oxidoreductase (luciferase family)